MFSNTVICLIISIFYTSCIALNKVKIDFRKFFLSRGNVKEIFYSVKKARIIKNRVPLQTCSEF